MKKLLFLLGLLLGFGTLAHATTVYQGCNIASKNSPFPVTPANLPPSTCGGGFTSTPFGPATSGPGVGDTLNFFALRSQYRLFFEVPGGGSADFGHSVNNIGAVSSFNNLVLDPVTSLINLQWGSGADISSPEGSLVNVFSCPGVNAAACATILTAMNANAINITTSYDHVTDSVGEVEASYLWVIDFSPATVPEPSSLSLLGASLFALGALWRMNAERWR